jgi:hypothetical protein
LVWVLDNYVAGPAFVAWETARYAAPATRAGPDPLAAPIESERREQWVRKVSKAYARTRVAMDGARSKGHDVSHLEPKLTRAMQMAKDGRFRDALFLMNLIEVRVPQHRERVVPAGQGDGLGPEEPSVEGAPVRPSPARRQAPAAGGRDSRGRRPR